MSDGTTHWAGCSESGPKHYKCALQEIGRLRLTITDLRVKLEKKEWVGLTVEEVAKCWSTSAVASWKNIEAKLREKNNEQG